MATRLKKGEEQTGVSRDFGQWLDLKTGDFVAFIIAWSLRQWRALAANQ